MDPLENFVNYSICTLTHTQSERGSERKLWLSCNDALLFFSLSLFFFLCFFHTSFVSSRFVHSSVKLSYHFVFISALIRLISASFYVQFILTIIRHLFNALNNSLSVDANRARIFGHCTVVTRIFQKSASIRKLVSNKQLSKKSTPLTRSVYGWALFYGIDRVAGCVGAEKLVAIETANVPGR